MNVSFIIPCYNEEEKIERCIISIMEEIHEQRIQAEIIVVDNNCTDRTVEIAKNLGVIVVQEPNKGVVWARQRGYLTAKYNLIANIDADSFVRRGWLSKAIENIKPNDVVAVTGPLNYYDASWWVRKSSKLYYLGAWLSNKFIGYTIQGGNCMIKKKYLEWCDGYDTSIQFYGEDTMTAKRIGRWGKVKFVFDMEIESSALVEREVNKKTTTRLWKN